MHADIGKLFEIRFYFDHFLGMAFVSGGFFGVLIFLSHIRPSSFNFSRISINEAGLLGSAFVFGSGTSGGLTLVSISFCIGALIVFLDNLMRGSFVFRIAALLYFGAVAVCLAQEKYQKPYHWWNIENLPVNTVHFSVWDTSQAKNLKAFETATSSCDRKPEVLLAYPHMTMFNVISGIPHYGRAITYWLDFLSDSHANAALESLKVKGPDLLILWDMPDLVYDTHSNLFKGGRALVQKEIYNFLVSRDFLQSYDHLMDIKDGDNLYRVFGKNYLNCSRHDPIILK